MKLSKSFLQELQKRLKIGNRRSTHLNALPKKSNYKLDFSTISVIEEQLPQDFLNILLSKTEFNFEISWQNKNIDLFNIDEKELKKIERIDKVFTSLQNQVQTIKEERGVDTFGFGYPLFIRRGRDKNLIVAPLIIWKLELKRSKKNNTWNIIKEQDSPIYLNEVLINHLQSDSDIILPALDSDILENGLIRIQELKQICKNVIEKTNITKISNIDEKLEEIFSSVSEIDTESHYEKLPLNGTNSLIENKGIFSYFEIQKHSIIQDYDDLIELEGEEIDQKDLEYLDFQSLTSVQTDPSQQQLLNNINNFRNIIIQGPPGTGKSQTLTALLTNALENDKKCLVVCEKNTALQVLKEGLEKLGLGSHIALIHDVTKNRKSIVSAVRDKTENWEAIIYPNIEHSYPSIIENFHELIDSINDKHKALDTKLLAEYNWSDIVGKYLENLRLNDNLKTPLKKLQEFNYTYDEYQRWNLLLEEGNQLYLDYISTGENTFIPNEKFLDTDFITFKDDFNEAFDTYESNLDEIRSLEERVVEEYRSNRSTSIKLQIESIENAVLKLSNHKINFLELIDGERREYVNLKQSDIKGDLSVFTDAVNEIQQLLEKHRNNIDFLLEDKLNTTLYVFKSWFSSEKRETIRDSEKFNQLYDLLAVNLTVSKYLPCLNKREDREKTIRFFQTFKKGYDSLLSNAQVEADNYFSNISKELQKIDDICLFDSFNKILDYLDEISQKIEPVNGYQKKVIDNICNCIRSFFNEQKRLYYNIKIQIDGAQDVDLKFTYSTDKVDNSLFLEDIKTEIKNISDKIVDEVESEIQNLDFIRDSKKFFELKSYQEINTKILDLDRLIQQNNYILNYKSPSLYLDFIQCVQNAIDDKKQFFDSNPKALRNTYNWIVFYEKLAKYQRNVIDQIKREKKWKYPFFVNYFDKLLKNNFNDIIPTDDKYINAFEERQVKLQDTQTKYINNKWYKKQHEAVNRFNTKSYTFQFKNLYNLKGSAGRSRFSLRKIIENDCDLFTDLHPIILTTPDVASSLFRDKNRYFDFVIFDEASQLRLEDNLPAMLKGKQIIIAGDEHQMPPSSFFDRIVSGEIDNEDDIEDNEDDVMKNNASKEELLLSSISLLDAARELNFENKDLSFHYRSKHPYLIDFSNYAFYNQKLIPLPITSHYNPIKYVNVNGVYHDNVNEKEAEVVLSILEHNIHKTASGEYPSVGIATFNVKQRDFIKNKIIERQKLEQYAEFNKKIAELEEKGLFIKNLENIQGDERDVIIISTTYGRAKNGSFYKRFGPLNQQKGYKLLNVIVTRAKYKNYIVTSIPEDDILNYNAYLITQQTNYSKAPIYAYLAYAKAVSEGNNEQRLAILNNLAANSSASSSKEIDTSKLESVFEEEVYERLSQTYLKDYLELQYKVGGFRIDMVIDFKLPNIPKIAIECDGAKYHSSNEAYLYDFHRQKILETHGFKFHRIWGTNWWQNPDYEMEQLLKFVEEIKHPQQGDLFLNIEEKDIFSDIIHFIDDEEMIVNDTSADDNVIIEEEQEQELKVGLNSVLNIEYQDTHQEFQICISTKEDSGGSLRKVAFKSPLGKALLGKSIGDIVKIEGLDRLVKIVDIKIDD